MNRSHGEYRWRTQALSGKDCIAQDHPAAAAARVTEAGLSLLIIKLGTCRSIAIRCRWLLGNVLQLGCALTAPGLLPRGVA